MSVISPFRDSWSEFGIGRPRRIFDRNWDDISTTEELWNSFSKFPSTSLFNHHYKPWSPTLTKQDPSPTVTSTNEKFEVILDVQQFLPKEIVVKTSCNNIVIEGKHEEKQDEHGFISRHFVRRYTLPHDFDVDKVVSNLSSDGILTVSAPKRGTKEIKTERIIPITQIGSSKSFVTPLIEES